jgi:hypothetical protein
MLNIDRDSPLALKISFNKLIKHYENKASSTDIITAQKANQILSIADRFPILREGFTDVKLLQKYEEEIAILLKDSFSSILTENEIKAATLPFQNIIFNSTARFKRIVKNAGNDFELAISNMTNDQFYVMGCVVVLGMHYGYNLDIKRPFYYEIPDANGVLKYYKILYNADFMEIEPSDRAIPITQQDVDELMDNFDEIALWKKKFPPHSYIAKGFVISNMFDATADVSISNIKSTLIKADKQQDDTYIERFHDVFRSLFNTPDLKVGFSIYNKEEENFERVYGQGITSYLLGGHDCQECSTALCPNSYESLIEKHTPFAISDVDKYYEMSKGMAPYKNLYDNGIKSAIFAPIAEEGGDLLGIIELVSTKAKQLNSINAIKLEDVMPFVVATVQRSKVEEANHIEAIIQQECTSIHSSVYWKFEQEAKRFLSLKLQREKQPTFSKISFDNVYPLYGQMDIKGSSDARNNATKDDLTKQLRGILGVFDYAIKDEALPIYEQLKYRIQLLLSQLSTAFQVDSEQEIVSFVQTEIRPLLKHLKEKNSGYKEQVKQYENTVDEQLGIVYDARKAYDDTVALINVSMASLIDRKQLDAQKMYPHYFERYKTDGVEHNMYIGEAITKEESFNPIYLYNLRLWQLQVMCEMENEYYHMQSDFPMQLDVASMILVFNSPLSISFRMDEKQFDVDGTYNARYEVVKKRVDKAFIKGTNTRITEKGKITIVYSSKRDEEEYLQYVYFLQSKNYLDKKVEILELQELQGVTGLKAIRVDVLYSHDDKKEFYTYNDLMKELKA